MNDNDFKFPEWQIPLSETMLEFDPERFNERAHNVKTLIYKRLAQLPSKNSYGEERKALNDALSMLEFLKRDKVAAWK
jgi:hypothetical protein